MSTEHTHRLSVQTGSDYSDTPRFGGERGGGPAKVVSFVSRAVQPPREYQAAGPAHRRVLFLDEEDMSNSENASAAGTPVRDIPIDWEALEDAFENNAPE